jgi:hypothetical protein
VAQARRDEVGLFQRDDPLQLQAFDLKREPHHHRTAATRRLKIKLGDRDAIVLDDLVGYRLLEPGERVVPAFRDAWAPRLTPSGQRLEYTADDLASLVARPEVNVTDVYPLVLAGRGLHFTVKSVLRRVPCPGLVTVSGPGYAGSGAGAGVACRGRQRRHPRVRRGGELAAAGERSVEVSLHQLFVLVGGPAGSQACRRKIDRRMSCRP